MCLLATCGIFWQKDLPLQELTCPCGHRYWDLFQDRFVDRESRSFDTDGRALPMPDRETTLREEMQPGAFEASIRVQFIVHCIGCGIRRRIDKGELGAGFDLPNFLRAMAELQEVANGDYTSRSRSRTFQEALPTRSQETSRWVQHQSSSDATADSAQSAQSARNPSVPKADRLSFRSTPKGQQETPLTQLSSAEAGPADRDFTSRTLRSSGDSGRKTQSSPRSSRDESRPTTAPRAERLDDDSAPPPILSALLDKFVAFGDSQYASIATFCNNNSQIWEEDPNSLQTALRYYLLRENTDRARRLAQRFLILTWSRRKSKTAADRQVWLSGLSRSTRSQRELDEDIESLLASVG